MTINGRGARCRLGWLVGASFVALAAPAAAQSSAQGTSPAPKSGDEGSAAADSQEIVVTARKRQENVREVPISINVTTAQTIERSGSKNLEDLAHMVPSLVVQQGSEEDSKSFL